MGVFNNERGMGIWWPKCYEYTFNILLMVVDVEFERSFQAKMGGQRLILLFCSAWRIHQMYQTTLSHPLDLKDGE